MEISNAQSDLSFEQSCLQRANSFLSQIGFSTKDVGTINKDNSIFLIQRIFNTSRKPFPIKQPCIIIDDYCFLEFLPALLSLQVFFDVPEQIDDQNQYPIEYSFEIFPSHEFTRPNGEMAMDQLTRVVDIMKDDTSLQTVPVVLGNSVLLDMLQDYLNQCASCNKDDQYCKALISVNGCSSSISISRDKLLLFIIHKKHFYINDDDPIPVPAKDRLPLIPIDVEEIFKVVFKEYSPKIDAHLQNLATQPNKFSLNDLIEPPIHPLLLQKQYDFSKFKNTLESQFGLRAVIKTVSSMFRDIDIKTEIKQISIFVNTIASEQHFVEKLKEFVESNKEVLFVRFDSFDPIQDQHLKFLVNQYVPLDVYVFFVYYRVSDFPLRSTLAWPIFFILEISSSLSEVKAQPSLDFFNSLFPLFSKNSFSLDERKSKFKEIFEKRERYDEFQNLIFYILCGKQPFEKSPFYSLLLESQTLLKNREPPYSYTITSIVSKFVSESDTKFRLYNEFPIINQLVEQINKSLKEHLQVSKFLIDFNFLFSKKDVKAFIPSSFAFFYEMTIDGKFQDLSEYYEDLNFKIIIRFLKPFIHNQPISDELAEYFKRFLCSIQLDDDLIKSKISKSSMQKRANPQQKNVPANQPPVNIDEQIDIFIIDKFKSLPSIKKITQQSLISNYIDQITKSSEKARKAVSLTANYEEALLLMSLLFEPTYPHFFNSVNIIKCFFPNSTNAFTQFFETLLNVSNQDANLEDNYIFGKLKKIFREPRTDVANIFENLLYSPFPQFIELVGHFLFKTPKPKPQIDFSIFKSKHDPQQVLYGLENSQHKLNFFSEEKNDLEEPDFSSFIFLDNSVPKLQLPLMPPNLSFYEISLISLYDSQQFSNEIYKFVMFFLEFDSCPYSLLTYISWICVSDVDQRENARKILLSLLSPIEKKNFLNQFFNEVSKRIFEGVIHFTFESWNDIISQIKVPEQIHPQIPALIVISAYYSPEQSRCIRFFLRVCVFNNYFCKFYQQLDEIGQFYQEFGFSLFNVFSQDIISNQEFLKFQTLFIQEQNKISTYYLDTFQHYIKNDAFASSKAPLIPLFLWNRDFNFPDLYISLQDLSRSVSAYQKNPSDFLINFDKSVFNQIKLQFDNSFNIESEVIHPSFAFHWSTLESVLSDELVEVPYYYWVKTILSQQSFDEAQNIQVCLNVLSSEQRKKLNHCCLKFICGHAINNPEELFFLDLFLGDHKSIPETNSSITTKELEKFSQKLKKYF